MLIIGWAPFLCFYIIWLIRKRPHRAYRFKSRFYKPPVKKPPSGLLDQLD
jgi:hypothetical protein